MNCINCDAHREDLQTGDHYCWELGALISLDAVKCPRKQAEKSFREYMLDRFNRKRIETMEEEK